MTATTTRSSNNGDSMTAPPPSLGPAAGTGQRSRQLPWVALGVLLVAGSMLGFALWSVSQSTRTPVLVAANDIDAGTVITEADLDVVSVGADPGIALLEADQAGLVVGELARGPIPAGTPLSAELVSSVIAVPSGSVVVGAALSPGEYPTGTLQAGDLVQIIETTDQTSASEGRAAAIVADARVWNVEVLLDSSETRFFVSLLVDADDVALVADLLDQDRLRLVLVGADS